MTWTAVVPRKAGPDCKSRLAGQLDRDARVALSDAMAVHVLGVLEELTEPLRVVVLSASEAQAEGRAWRRDMGRGLNVELAAYADDLDGLPLLVVHADLPTLVAGDVRALISGANEVGIAIAPDRVGLGTNAVALRHAASMPLAFGPDSFAKHRGRAGPRACIVRRPGLALDIDLPEDLAAAIALDAPGLTRGWGRRAPVWAR